MAKETYYTDKRDLLYAGIPEVRAVVEEVVGAGGKAWNHILKSHRPGIVTMQSPIERTFQNVCRWHGVEASPTSGPSSSRPWTPTCVCVRVRVCVCVCVCVYVCT